MRITYYWMAVFCETRDFKNIVSFIMPQMLFLKRVVSRNVVQQTRGTGSPTGGSMNRSPPTAVSMITWAPAVTLPMIAASFP